MVTSPLAEFSLVLFLEEATLQIEGLVEQLEVDGVAGVDSGGD